uniref:Uncharacterized protein n=1 Tax=Candidatus Kentrum sp. LFY TaxID=2126342 RepID=A0A450X6Z4_9GAMM|nr:MAG: hypothetical protein BECKLFY1418C_GA0070996_12143 [Candidatus Kentron sp. LFY]
MPFYIKLSIRLSCSNTDIAIHYDGSILSSPDVQFSFCTIFSSFINSIYTSTVMLLSCEGYTISTTQLTTDKHMIKKGRVSPA